jgi:hypothetical protein
MTKTRKSGTKRIAIMRDSSQLELSFAPKIKITPIFPYGKPSLEQKFYPKLMRDKVLPKKVGKDDEMEDFIVGTIRKGLRLFAKIILNNNLNYVEIKALTTIIINYLPNKCRNSNEMESTQLWSKFNRFLTRSNRRTSMFRLANACQKMGRELPETAEDCNLLINKIYNLIRGDTGKICCNADRNDWENSLESKPIKYFRVGDALHEKL